LKLLARSPNRNAYAERWVRSVKEECLSKLILFGEGGLQRALDNYRVHYQQEPNHQGKGNVLVFPQTAKAHITADIECHQRLGGLLRYYHRKAA
jgi:putative transposase